ncbi:3-keto-disaccharide hydrolase [Formosa sp. 4Alg 33]|uniref:3-keto-disaccharide hydrolase n=1 Tax=Formosa sp. 4Alg 33 TaxID=3382189 RepID=UPI003D9C4592
MTIKTMVLSASLLFCMGVPLLAQDQSNSKVLDKDGFETLFNGKNFDGWYLKLRNGDDVLAKKVFAIENDMVHVFNDAFPDEYELNTGENNTHGLFYTKKTYSKYILKFEYKWGSRVANNFERWQYDAGVYYHITNDAVWPTGIEYQVRYDQTTKRNHTGDLIRPKDVTYDWYRAKDSETYLHPKQGGVLDTSKSWLHHATPTRNFKALDDQWNQCEIIVMGDKYTIHKLNGDIVNMAFNLNPSSGIIGFQSETAEIYYRDIKIKEFDEVVPAETFLK